jgi:hypothetical protein
VIEKHIRTCLSGGTQILGFQDKEDNKPLHQRILFPLVSKLNNYPKNPKICVPLHG